MKSEGENENEVKWLKIDSKRVIVKRPAKFEFPFASHRERMNSASLIQMLADWPELNRGFCN